MDASTYRLHCCLGDTFHTGRKTEDSVGCALVHDNAALHSSLAVHERKDDNPSAVPTVRRLLKLTTVIVHIR